jgi:hypothetical protein
MPGKRRTVSYSQYSVYKQCPHLWYLQYGKGLYDFKPSIYLVFGTSLHETLQLWLKVMYTQSGKASDQMDLAQDFKSRFLEEYRKRVAENKGEHFATKEQLREFYQDGVTILEWVRKKRKRYFSLRDVELIGIEIPLSSQANRGIDNVFFKGAIDFVLYSKKANRYSIYDIKTSTTGWSKDDKKDDVKINQILLYKKHFGEAFNVYPENIDVTFFIVRRKLLDAPEDIVIPRVQEFIPAHGKIKVKKAETDFNNFLAECFTPEGRVQEKVHLKNVGKACKYCPFNDSPDLCNKENT